MTELKIYLKPLTDKNAQLVTCGIFYCRESAKMKGCSSLQTSSWFDSDVLRNRQQKLTAVRWQQLIKEMNKVLTIIFSILINYIANGQIHNSEWLYFDNMTVRSYVDTLTIKTKEHNTTYILITGNKAKADWIKKSDLEFLITLIDSRTPAYCVMQSISSQLPINEESTLGGQVMNLIDAYRLKKEYPYFQTDCSKTDDKRKQEILSWYEEYKKE